VGKIFAEKNMKEHIEVEHFIINYEKNQDIQFKHTSKSLWGSQVYSDVFQVEYEE